MGTLSGGSLGAVAQTVAFNATTMSVNFALGTEVTFGTQTANVTAMSAPSNIPAAGTICRFYMLQDGTGGRTFTWATKFVGTINAGTALNGVTAKLDADAGVTDTNYGSLWPAQTGWPTNSGTANQVQVLTGVSNGTNIIFQSSSGWFTAT